MDIQKIESYYNSSEENAVDGNNFFADKKKLVFGLIFFLAIIFLLIIIFSGEDISSKKFTLSSNGENIKFNGTISADGSVIDSFSQDGESVKVISNGKDNFNVVIATSGVNVIKLGEAKITSISGGQVFISSLGGQIISLSEEDFFIDEEGNIVLKIDPLIDLGIDPNKIDFSSNQTLDFEFQITFTDEETGQNYTVLIPVEMFFSEFMGGGCIQLSREFIRGVTNYGRLEIDLKVRIVCDTYDDLYSFVEWKDEEMGNVEVHFQRTYPTTLTNFSLAVRSNPVPNDYDVKIIYTPHILNKGKRANFKVNFELENSIQEISFDVVNENLMQCVQVTTIKDTIENDNDTALIRIDTTKCTNPVEISICHNDYGCTDGIEGEIIPSLNMFNLNKSVQTISFSRKEIAGVYGVKIYARVLGTGYQLIDEKEILVLPTDETIYPNKFVFSLFDRGAREVVQIKNEQLTQNVLIDTSICNLYESSFGVSAGGLPFFGEFVNEKEWLNYLVNNSESYSGEGFYQRALIDSMPYISSARSTAYNISAQENTKIKQAYLSIQEFDDSATKMRLTSDDLVLELEKLKNDLDKLNKNPEIDLASQLAAIVSSTTALYADITALRTNISAAQVSITALAGRYSATCTAAMPNINAANAAIITANSNSILFHAEAFQLISSLKDLYTIYQQIEEISNEKNTIDAENAFDNSKKVNDKLVEIENKMDKIFDYLELALSSAAVNSFESASKDYLDSKNYLELALIEMKDIERLNEEIIELNLNANDDLTLLSEDIDEKTELLIAGSFLMIDLISRVGLMQTKAELIRVSVTTAQTNLATALGIAIGVTKVCAGPQYLVCAVLGESGCLLLSTEGIPPVQAQLTTIQAQLNSSYLLIGQKLATINTIYKSYQLYESLQNEFSANVNKVYSDLEELTNDLYDFELIVLDTVMFLEESIEAADNLSDLQKEMSRTSTYTNNLNLSQEFGEYDRERLVGLVSTLIQNGFFNGAYSAGIYTKRDTGPIIFSENQNKENEKINFSNNWVEDCENRVELTLPMYKTNLVNDAKRVEVEGANIATEWLFNDAKIIGVYENQIVDLLFINNDLRENSYALITIPFTQHEYDVKNIVNQKFYPFNIPTTKITQKEYKFRVKFNSNKREGSIQNYDSICENDLGLGVTGEDALAKIILGWDFENINLENTKDKYLDATQLSILVSKKLSEINNYLLNKDPICPKNQVQEIMNRILPREFNIIRESDDCFLPLSTKEFDEKPALYYYLKSNNDDLGDLISIIDFNVNLIRDGYGSEFQSDFVQHYTRRILAASPDFLDSDNGMSRYFRSPQNFYFTSKNINLERKNDFVLNDTGLYNVKLLIDFSELPLISMGKMNAKIKVVLDLVEPIKENFSPFYYLPLNGMVGLGVENDRRFYGASLMNDSSMKIINYNNTSLSGNQRDSLVKVNYELRNDFFELNSLKSNKSNLFEIISNKDNTLSIINSPTTATPLLFELTGFIGDDALITYSVLRNQNNFRGRTHNLFLMDSIESCNDFYGLPLNYIRSSPDFLVEENYAFGYSDVIVPGKVFTHTIVYSPIKSDFSIKNLQSDDFARIISSKKLGENISDLKGIDNMKFNDDSKDNVIESLNLLFDAVKEGYVCVMREASSTSSNISSSSSGQREIYYWPEKLITDFEDNSGFSLRNEINIAKNQCIN